jgi:hypothetical protein
MRRDLDLNLGFKRMLAEATTKPRPGLFRQAHWITVAFLAVMYLVTPTSDYYWDGITFALQIEKVAKAERGAELLFHQNHLIYNGFGYVLYRTTQALGFSIRALQVLQIANAIAGAIAVGVFYRLAFHVTRSRVAAILSGALLAFSAVWWRLATDANAYVISILLILVCARALLANKPSWMGAGLALAGAMLFHQLASLFYPAALAAILANPHIGKKGRVALGLSALAWGPALCAYYLCASLLNDIKDPMGVIRWATSNPSGVSPSGNPLRGIALLPRGNLDLIVGHNFALYRSQDGWIEHLLTLIAMCTAIGFIIKAAREPRRSEFKKGLYQFGSEIRARWRLSGSMLAIWAGAYMAFQLFWEPGQTLYRAFYLPALALGFALILWNLRQVMGASLTNTAALAIATLAFFNLSFFVLPHMRANANPKIAAARQANQVWNEATLIYFADRKEVDTAFEYFNDKTDWRRLNPATKANIDDEIRLALDQGKQVWLNKGAVAALGSEWLARRARGREILLEEPQAPAHYIELR